MSKHTPGPWKALHSVGEWIIKSACGKYIGGLVIGGRECRANAKLIAAAPELLEALTTGAQLNMPDFLEWIAARLVNVHGEDPNVDYVQTLRHRAKLCREAIAKATGNGA